MSQCDVVKTAFEEDHCSTVCLILDSCNRQLQFSAPFRMKRKTNINTLYFVVLLMFTKGMQGKDHRSCTRHLPWDPSNAAWLPKLCSLLLWSEGVAIYNLNGYTFWSDSFEKFRVGQIFSGDDEDNCLWQYKHTCGIQVSNAKAT